MRRPWPPTSGERKPETKKIATLGEVIRDISTVIECRVSGIGLSARPCYSKVLNHAVFVDAPDS